MRKINYALIGILIAAIIYGVLYSGIPKVLVPDIDKNIQYLDGLETDDYVDLSNVVTMIGYQVYSQDIDNRITNNIFAYGRSNPMYFIKINIPQLKEEHKEVRDENSSSSTATTSGARRNRYYVYPYSGGEEFFSDSTTRNLSTYMNDYNMQFSMVNKNSIVGYNKRTSEMELVDLGSLLPKIRKDARLPIDQEYLSISSKFGARVDPFNYSIGSGPITQEDFKLLPFHTGLDLSDSGINGSNVYSMLDGTVKRISKSNSGYGNLVVIDHGGFETYYAHMSSIRSDLREGTFVLAGENIGQVGSTGRSTGPHLHLEFVFDNVAVNPELFIPATAFKIKSNSNLNPTANIISKLNFKDREEEIKEAKKEDEEKETVEKQANPKPKRKQPVQPAKTQWKPRPKPVSKPRPKPEEPKKEDRVEEKTEPKIELEPLPQLDDNWGND